MSEVGCFVALAEAVTGNLLFVRDHSGKLGFVGGGVDVDETYAEAAVRESFEEIGIVLKPNDLTSVSFRKAPAGSGIASTMLFHAGHNWQTRRRNRLILPSDLQCSEIAEIISIPISQIVVRPENFKSDFYIGHWDMLGTYVTWLRSMSEISLYLSTVDKAWGNKILERPQ